MRFSWLALITPLFLVSCGSKGAVALTVSIQDATVRAMPGALGATLSGSFRLQFDLGPEASGPAKVDWGNFTLQSAAGAPIVDQLVIASDVTFPLEISPGGSQRATITLSQQGVLSDAQQIALCAGQVRIVGAVTDSLKDGTDPVQSLALTPNCS